MGHVRLRLFGARFRYAQPKGSAVRVYYPHIGSVNWSYVLKDPALSFLITEGEIKAACATKHGFPTIGLGGVYAWRSTKQGQTLIPDLEKVVWRGRTVTLVFDSDVMRKDAVLAALLHLSETLLSRGAIPRIAKLPVVNGQDMGLDDYIVSQGTTALKVVLQGAQELTSTHALHSLNQQVAFVRDQRAVVELETGTILSYREFQDASYRTHHHDEVTSKGVKRVPTAKMWLAWEGRREVRGIVYAPGRGRFPNGDYNIWPGWGVEPVRGSITPWRLLLDHLFKGEPESRSWFERWCAYPIQNPGAKMTSSALLWGLGEGTGKSLIGVTLEKIYGRTGQMITQQQLESRFTEWALGRSFIRGEEVSGSDSRKSKGLLKLLISEETVYVDQKYVRPFSVRNCVNLYFTSNEPTALFLSSRDRRHFVHEVRVEKLPDSFYKEYDAWLHSTGPAHLRYHLERLKLGDFHRYSVPPMTKAKEEMIELGRSELEAWVAALVRDPDQALRIAGGHVPGDLHTSAELLAIYTQGRQTTLTTQGMGRALKKQEVWQSRLTHTQRGSYKFYAIRNAKKWMKATPKQLAAHYMASKGA